MAVSTEKDEIGQDTGLLKPVPREEVVFGGEGLAVTLEGDVHEHQLIEEVYAHLGDRDAHEVVTTEDGDGVKTLHVLGTDDLDGVKQVARAHTPDPDFGLSEEAKELRELRRRLKDGQDLKTAELNRILRSMMV